MKGLSAEGAALAVHQPDLPVGIPWGTALSLKFKTNKSYPMPDAVRILRTLTGPEQSKVKTTDDR